MASGSQQLKQSSSGPSGPIIIGFEQVNSHDRERRNLFIGTKRPQVISDSPQSDVWPCSGFVQREPLDKIRQHRGPDITLEVVDNDYVELVMTCCAYARDNNVRFVP